MARFVWSMIFCLIVLSSFVLADSTYYYKVNTPVNIITFCDIGGGACGPSVACNLTAVYPNTSILFQNKGMTNQGSYFNYSFTPTLAGDYTATVYCNDGVVNNSKYFVFTVNSRGDSFKPVMIGIYAILILIVAAYFYLANTLKLIDPVFNKMLFFTGIAHILGILFIAYLDFNNFSGIELTIGTLFAINLIVTLILIYLYMFKQVEEAADDVLNED